MNDLDMDSLLSAEDDDGRPRRRSRASSGRGGGNSRRRRRRRNRGGFLAPLLALMVLVGVLGGGGYYAYLLISDAMVPDDYTGQGSGEVTIEIKPNQTASDVAQTLEEKGVVMSARAFTNAIDAAGKGAALQPGEYTMRLRMSAADAVVLLDSGNKLSKKVLIKEGLRLSDILAALAEQTGKPVAEFKAAAKDVDALDLPPYAKNRLEGYAFPATYSFSPKLTPTEMLAKMVERYKSAADQADLEAGAKRLGRTPHEIITIASIIQREAGRFEDMPKISRVIYNRLDGEPERLLEMDSTIMYALNKYETAATNAELEVKSPYNTYKHMGLPPGPIASPGDHAIEAALKPARGDWEWFVATDPNSDVTKFASTEAEFVKLKAEFEANRGN